MGAQVLRNTMAQVALNHIDDRSKALREAVLEMLSMDEPRKHTATVIFSLDVHYDLGEPPAARTADA